MRIESVGGGRVAAPHHLVFAALATAVGCDGVTVPPERIVNPIQWEVPVQNGHGVPVQDSLTVYAQTTAHELLAITKATGAVRWRAPLSTGRSGWTRGWGSAIAGDVIASSDWEIYGLDRATGRQLWVFARPNSLPGYSLLTSDDTAFYVGSVRDGWVYAVTATTGQARWEVQIDTARLFVAWDPVVRDGLVFVPYEKTTPGRPDSGGVVALDSRTGAVRWRRVFTAARGRSSGGDGPAVFANDLVMVAASDGTIWALVRATGEIRWKAAPIDSAADDIRPLVVVGGVLVAASNTMKITGYDVASGAVLWSMVPPGLGSVVGWMSTDGTSFFAEGSAKLMRGDPRTGKIVWTRGDHYATPCFMQGSVVDERNVYASGCTAIYALTK